MVKLKTLINAKQKSSIKKTRQINKNKGKQRKTKIKKVNTTKVYRDTLTI